MSDQIDWKKIVPPADQPEVDDRYAVTMGGVEIGTVSHHSTGHWWTYEMAEIVAPGILDRERYTSRVRAITAMIERVRVFATTDDSRPPNHTYYRGYIVEPLFLLGQSTPHLWRIWAAVLLAERPTLRDAQAFVDSIAEPIAKAVTHS